MWDTILLTALITGLVDLMLIPAIVYGAKYIARYIVQKSHDKTERLEKMEAGVLATLRQQYLTTAFFYIEKGWIPFSIADSMEQIYVAYNSLGGNGTVTEVRNTVIKLERKM